MPIDYQENVEKRLREMAEKYSKMTQEAQPLTPEPTPEAPQPLDRRTIGDKIRGIIWKGVEPIIGAGEAAATVGTGIPSAVAGFGAQAVVGLYDWWKEGFRDIDLSLDPTVVFDQFLDKIGAREEIKQKVSELGTYRPKTEFGKLTARVALAPFEGWNRMSDAVARYTSDDLDTQGGVRFLGDAILFLAIPHGVAWMKQYMRTPKPFEVSTAVKILTESPKTPSEIKARAREIESIYKFEKAYRESQQAYTDKTKRTWGQVKKDLKRTLVDTSGNLKTLLLKRGGKEGKEAVIHHDLIQGTTPKANRIISKAKEEIYKGLKKADTDMLHQTITARRMITVAESRARISKLPELDRATQEGIKQLQDMGYDIKRPEYQFTGELTPEDAQAVVNSASPELMKRADAYFDSMRGQRRLLLDEGLINEGLYNYLETMHPEYSPFQFLKHIDPMRTYSVGGKKITVPDSGIRALEEGSAGAMQMNTELLLEQTVSRVQARIFKNRATEALGRFAEAFPDNEMGIRMAKVIRATKEGKPILEIAPPGHDIISFMRQGQHKEIIVPTEWAQEWVTRDPAISAGLANTFAWLSGSKILKPMATGLNPEFAITNFPRDILHSWLVTNEFSSFFPKGMMQMGQDLATVARDVFTRTGRWVDAIDEGIGMDFLTHQGRITNKATGVFRDIQDVMGYLGETSEMWVRLAIRERAIRNGKSPAEATWIARTYLDFSQGGSVAKAIDSGVPYLNAGIQGTRGVFRAVADRPAQTLFKFAQLGTLSTGLYLANKYTNPEAWDSISDREKANNFIITTPFSYTDENDNKRYIYFRVAKDQGQRIVSTAFENLTAKAIGEDVDADQIIQAIQDFLPIMPTEQVPPSVDAVLGYILNRDLWTRKDIWTGPEGIQSSKEKHPGTSPVLVEIGDLTGLSPERLNYALKQYFTRGNIYTDLVGGGIKSILGQVSEEWSEKQALELISKAPGARRVMRATHPYTAHQKDLERIRKEENTKRWERTVELDSRAEAYFNQLQSTGLHDPVMRENVINYVDRQPPEEQDRLMQRWIRYGKIHDVPDKTWWLNMAHMSPEARALVYWTRWRKADDEEKRRLLKTVSRVSGVITPRFNRRLDSLKQKDKYPIMREK